MTTATNLVPVPQASPLTNTITPFTQAPSIGQLVYLAAYMFQVTTTAVATMPDTPNQYSAQLKIMGDQGEMDLSPLAGDKGPAGQALFVLRDMTEKVIVNNTFELPQLNDIYEDIGKYWRLDILDEFGFVSQEIAYVWYGNGWRAFMMGSFGPPGPIPSITPSCRTIEPGTPSYITTDGPTFQPSWQFELAVPQGSWGAPAPVGYFPDVEEGNAGLYNVLTAVDFLESGTLLWKPLRVDAGVLGPYSMTEDDFVPFYGTTQQAPIGSFVIPPQPFPWTPVVWGHIGGIGGQGQGGSLVGGILGLIVAVIEGIIEFIEGLLGGGLSAAPVQVGCQVMLGDPVNGQLVARGFGNPTGVVNIGPHYSGATNTKLAISPTNNLAVVPAYHTVRADGTLYVNLWNDGVAAAYQYNPEDSQLFIAVLPISPPFTTITGEPAIVVVNGVGKLTATCAVIGTGGALPAVTGKGVLSAVIKVIGG